MSNSCVCEKDVSVDTWFKNHCTLPVHLLTHIMHSYTKIFIHQFNFIAIIPNYYWIWNFGLSDFSIVLYIIVTSLVCTTVHLFHFRYSRYIFRFYTTIFTHFIKLCSAFNMNNNIHAQFEYLHVQFLCHVCLTRCDVFTTGLTLSDYTDLYIILYATWRWFDTAETCGRSIVNKVYSCADWHF